MKKISLIAPFLLPAALTTQSFALTDADISGTDAFQYANITLGGGTGVIGGGLGNNAVDGMFGGLGMAPAEPGTTIFTDFVQFNSVLDNRPVNTLDFSTITPTTLAGMNVFLAGDPASNARAAKSLDFFADTDGVPGFQLTDDHVFVPVIYDANGRAFFFVPFSTTASHFYLELEPYFNQAANQWLGVRVLEFDAVVAAGPVPEPATLGLAGLAVPLLLRRRK